MACYSPVALPAGKFPLGVKICYWPKFQSANMCSLPTDRARCHRWLHFPVPSSSVATSLYACGVMTGQHPINRTMHVQAGTWFAPSLRLCSPTLQLKFMFHSARFTRWDFVFFKRHSTRKSMPLGRNKITVINSVSPPCHGVWNRRFKHFRLVKSEAHDFYCRNFECVT